MLTVQPNVAIIAPRDERCQMRPSVQEGSSRGAMKATLKMASQVDSTSASFEREHVRVFFTKLQQQVLSMVSPGSIPNNSSTTPAASISKTALWTGRVLSTLPVLLLIMSSAMKISKNPQVIEGFAKFGFPPGLEVNIGLVELVCTVLYVIPRTAAIGAILLTGYLGGAVVVHVRGGEPWFAPVVIGVVLWTGLVLRNPRLRSILPW